jgi:hypothetical protein
MGDQALTPTDTNTEPTVTPSALPTPSPIPVVEAQHEPKVVSGIATHRLLKDDEDVPGGDEVIALPAKALKSRFDRYSKNQLKERFGSDSYEEINTRLSRLSELEAEAESRALAELSEVDRERELRNKAEERALSWERKYTEQHEARAMSEIDTEISAVLDKHFDGMWIEGMVGRLATYLGSKSHNELRDVGSVVETWCQSELAKTPQFAKGYVMKLQEPAPTPTPAPAPRMVVPFSNGATAARPAQGAPPLMDKTPAPGRANSMSEDEWKRYKQQNGIQY